MPRTTLYTVLLLRLACFTCTLHAQETGVSPDGPTSSDLEKRIFIYEVEREELKKPLLDLQAKYSAALDRLTLTAQEAGKLEEVLALKKERGEFTSGRVPEDGTSPQILNLRAVYERELAKLLIEANAEEAELKKGLIQEVENLKIALTKAGQLEEAIKVAANVVGIENARTIEEEFTKGESLFFLKDPAEQMEVSGCLLEIKEGQFHLSVANGQNIAKLTTREHFSPPFTATWEVSTDGGNIRTYYANLSVILNHESGRHHLQVKDPALGGKAEQMIPNFGRVSADEFHEIKLVVEEDRFSFAVNGETRAEGKGNYGDLRSPVSIGPAFGSKLRLRRFEISQ